MLSTVTGKDLPLLGGIVCLDFVNTVDPRLAEPREDFLKSFEELAEWGTYVGLLSVSGKRTMLREGASDPAAASALHDRSIILREALYRLFRARDRSVSDALAALNSELQRAAAVVSVQKRKGSYELAWPGSTVGDGLLGAVARSAVDLLTSAELAYVRECAGDGCGWLFLDTSKAHRRQWCSMAICGNRAKARRHRRRRSPSLIGRADG